MTFEEFLNFVDPERKNGVWIDLWDDDLLQCKINSVGLFCEAFYERKIKHIAAREENYFSVALLPVKEENNGTRYNT